MALGRLGDPLDGDCVLVEARDAQGRLRGFLSFVPWGRTGLSLDLMRRDPAADNGLVELMVASLAERAATFGVGPGVAELRDVPRGVRAGRRDRRRADRAPVAARRWSLASRNWQLESLYRSNAKYQPRLAAAVHLLRVRLGPAAGRDGGRQRRGLPRRARRLAAARPTRTRPAGSDDRSDDGRLRRRRSSALIPPAPDPVEARARGRAPARADAGPAGQARTGSARAASTPTRSAYPRTHTLAAGRAPTPGDLPPDTRTGETSSRSPAG